MDETLREQQLCMTRFIRAPQAHPPPPGIETRRLAVYRRLFLGNVQGLLAGSFPVLRATLADEQWQALSEDFYARHRCHTPLFTEVAGEWVDYLEQRVDLPGWIAELAHYEWIETVLLLSDSTDPVAEPEGDLLEGVPQLSSLAMPLAYLWPVSHIGPGHLPPETPGEPTLLLARRGVDQKVHFSRLTPLAYRLLVSLREQRLSGREHLEVLAEQAGIERSALEVQGIALLLDLKAQGAVLI